MNLAGAYYDPKHGGCLRTIRHVEDNMWTIEGSYGDDEEAEPGTPWRARLYKMMVYREDRHEEESKFLTVDFLGKKTSHSRVYHALWCPLAREIHWEDGNVWKQLYDATNLS
jgi:hypothetical protein